MYIKLSTLGYLCLGILGAVALAYLILSLNKLFKVLSKVDKIIDSNEENINDLVSSLPKASENIVSLTENLKDVSEVITETTADAIGTKEQIKEYISTGKDIISIINKIFFKDK